MRLKMYVQTEVKSAVHLCLRHSCKYQTHYIALYLFYVRIPNTFYTGMTDFDFTIIAKSDLDESNQLHNILTTFINVPHCYSGNAIIISDFNQSSDITTLDQGHQYQQLHYTGDTAPARIYER